MSLTDLATMWSSLHLQLDAHRPRPAAHDPGPPERPPVPVCLLTGFLGAGKSTLLAALLGTPPDGLVVRAVVNDVGSLRFDPSLVTASDDIRVELSNGCGCCEQTTELARTLADMATAGPDLIVLEASGAADPLAIAQVVEANTALVLDRIVAVVDGSSAHAHLSAERGAAPPAEIAMRQLDAAHCVVVTHVDLLDADALAPLLAAVGVAAPGRIVQASSRTRPVVDLLVPSGRRGARPSPTSRSGSHQLFTVTVRVEGSLNSSRFRAALSAARPGLLRVKGRVVLDGLAHVVQMTPSTLTIEPTDHGPYGMTLVAVNEGATRGVLELMAAQG